jgi:hypothetical protein
MRGAVTFGKRQRRRAMGTAKVLGIKSRSLRCAQGKLLATRAFRALRSG